MRSDWLDSSGSVLAPTCPLPLDAPFTAKLAHDWGVSRRVWVELRSRGLIRQVLSGVYVVSQAPNDELIRVLALGLVLPPDAVVVDRTAAWLHGVDVLPRSALHEPPPLDVIHTTDTRMQRPESDGRRRGLALSDVTIVRGVPVTTPLRTALDLGRLLWRYDALAAIDGFLRIGVPHDQLAEELPRFKGYRGVIQLRYLLPLGDARAESGPESALRLHWHDAGLPWPEPQFWVLSDAGTPLYRIDIADPERRFGAEYDGVEFHTDDEDVDHDESRRRWLTDQRHWLIEPFRKDLLYSRPKLVPQILQARWVDAGRSMSRWSPARRHV